MKRVKMRESGLEVEERVAGAEAIGEFWKGEAMTKEIVLDMSIIEGRKEIEDGVDLFHPVGDVTREGDYSQEGVTVGGGAGNTAVERVGFGRRHVTAPNERLGGIEVEPHRRTKGAEEVKGAPKILSLTD